MTREQAIKVFNSYCSERYLADTRLQEACGVAIEALQDKTGHWILDDIDNSITCDKCGCLIYANDILQGDAHFCPNCGADMRGK